MFNKKILSVSVLVLLSTTNLYAEFLPWKTIEDKFKAENLNVKALGHVKCFFEKHENTVFQKKLSYDSQRCGRTNDVTLDQKRVFALIDYTAPSNQRRMFLVDRKTGGISTMAVAHGKYNAGVFNRNLSTNKNSVKHARYYSNAPGSNAPSSGFYVAGDEYEGKFGRSLILHGLETGINDNACERAVVIHKHKGVTDDNAYIMSSGCPMVNKSYLDHVVNLLKAPASTQSGNESNGSVVFIYGERESKWAATSCEGNFKIY